MLDFYGSCTYVALDRRRDTKLFGYEGQRGCNHGRGEWFQERKESHRYRRSSAYPVGPLSRINGCSLIIMFGFVFVVSFPLPWQFAHRHGALHRCMTRADNGIHTETYHRIFITDESGMIASSFLISYDGLRSAFVYLWGCLKEENARLLMMNVYGPNGPQPCGCHYGL
jgi:hypothetical protein